jgi:hypothetical protein
LLRQASGDRYKEVSRGVGHDRGDKAFERAGSGQHDLPPAQSFFDLGQQLGRGAPLQRTRAQPVAQFVFRRFVKPAQAQITTNPLCLDPFRRLTTGTVKEQHRRQSELTREMIDDLDGSVPVVVKEAAVRAQHAELQGKAATLIGATTRGDRGQIRGRQAPVPRQLVLAWIGWQRRPSTGLGGRG